MLIPSFVKIAAATTGSYVSGLLLLADTMGLDPVCGKEGGCARVLSSPLAHPFGIPLAMIGVAGWGVLLALALLETRGDSEGRTRAGRWLGILAALGAVVSLGLQGYALFVVRDVCVWCLASAVAMFVLLGVHALFPIPPRQAEAGAVAGALLVLAGIGIAAFPFVRPRSASGPAVLRVPLAELAPADSRSLGSSTAERVVVYFGDFGCPACATTGPRLRATAARSRFARFVYRHFPSSGHPGAFEAACHAEALDDRGFWKALAEGERHSLAGGFRGRAAPATPEATARVLRDELFARRHGLSGTPAIFVYERGGPARRVLSREADTLLLRP